MQDEPVRNCREHRPEAVFATVILLLVTAVLAACSGGSGAGPEASSTDMQIQVIGDARWPRAFGVSLESMLDAYPFAVVGEVVSYRNEDFSPPLPLSGEGISPPPAPFVVSEFKINKALRGAATVGDVIQVSQTGAREADASGKVIEYRLQAAPLLRENTTYLIFARPFEGGPHFVTVPFGVFRIDAATQKLMVNDPSWSRLGIAEALTDLDLQGAEARLEAVGIK